MAIYYPVTRQACEKLKLSSVNVLIVREIALIALIAWRGKVTRNMRCGVIERMHHT